MSIINFLTANGNCKDNYLNVGTSSCEIKNMGDSTGAVLVRKGYKFKKTDFTREGWTALLKKGIVFPFSGIYSFSQDTPEATTSTSDTGVMMLIRDGKPQFSYILTDGLCRHKKFWDKKKGDWDIINLFESGMHLAVDFDGEHAVGFDASFFSVESLRYTSSADPQQTQINIQLRNAEQFNMQSYFLLWEDLGFDANRINAPVEVNLTEVDLTTEANSGTEVKVKVTNYCNSDNTIAELEDKTNWLFNGAEPTAVSVDTATGEYTLTVPNQEAGASYTIYLDGEDAVGQMYKGNTSGVVSAA